MTTKDSKLTALMSVATDVERQNKSNKELFSSISEELSNTKDVSEDVKQIDENVSNKKLSQQELIANMLRKRKYTSNVFVSEDSNKKSTKINEIVDDVKTTIEEKITENPTTIEDSVIQEDNDSYVIQEKQEIWEFDILRSTDNLISKIFAKKILQ